MASLSPLSRHLINSAQQLHLEATSFSWTKEWLPDYIDLRVAFTADGRQFLGRGISSSQKSAWFKAASEAMERAVTSHHRLPSTNGVAAHATQKEADLHAALELLERDRFFCHFLTKTPPFCVSKDIFSKLPFSFEKIQNKMADHRVCFNLYELTRALDASTFLCVADGRDGKTPFGFIIGLGASPIPERAAEKAILECLLSAVAVLHGEGSAILLENFPTNGARPEDHFSLALDLEYAESISSFFENALSSTPPTEEISLSDCRVRALLPPTSLKELPLFFSVAENPALQSAYFGLTLPERVNLQRLSSFCGRALKWEDLMLLPHLMG